MMSFIKRIMSTPLVKNTMKLSASNVALMFLPLLVTPILSRLYTPEDYGLWGIYSSLLFIITSFIFLSYENVIVKTQSEKEVPSIIILCLLVSSIIIIATIAVIGVGSALRINYFVNFPAKALFIITLVVSSINTLLLNISNRCKLYGKMSIGHVINGMGQAAIRVLLGIFPVITFGLMVGNMGAILIAAVLMLYFTFPYIRSLKWEGAAKDVCRLTKKYRKFPLYDAPSRFLEFTIGNVVIIILSFYFNTDSLGCYSMVVQFILMPISVIGSAMGNVYYKELSDSISLKENIAEVTSKALKISFFLSLVPLLFLALGGDKLLVLFLGKQWEMAGKMALCMAIYSVPVILTEPLLPAFRALDKQEYRFRFNIVNLIMSIGTLLLCCSSGINIFLTLILYSSVYSAVRFLMYRKLLFVTGVHGRFYEHILIVTYIIIYIILGTRLILTFLI